MTRESAWNDETRDRAIALRAYDESLCGCGCGLPIAEAHEPQTFLVDAVTCYAGRALAQAKRAEHEEATRKKKPEGWDDGRHHFVKPYDTGQEAQRGD